MAPTGDPKTFLESSHAYLIPWKVPHWYLKIVKIRLTLDDGYVRHESASFDIAFFNKGWGLTFTITCQLSVVTIIQLWVGTTPNKIFLFTQYVKIRKSTDEYINKFVENLQRKLSVFSEYCHFSWITCN